MLQANLQGERQRFTELERRSKLSDLWERRNDLEGKQWKECWGSRSWMLLGRAAKIAWFGDQCGRPFLSASEGAYFNGCILSCAPKQRTSKALPWDTVHECAEDGRGKKEGICRWLLDTS